MFPLSTCGARALSRTHASPGRPTAPVASTRTSRSRPSGPARAQRVEAPVEVGQVLGRRVGGVEE
eukprot:6160491-Pyramimonas_sp.AAC.1